MRLGRLRRSTVDMWRVQATWSRPDMGCAHRATSANMDSPCGEPVPAGTAATTRDDTLAHLTPELLEAVPPRGDLRQMVRPMNRVAHRGNARRCILKCDEFCHPTPCSDALRPWPL